MSERQRLLDLLTRIYRRDPMPAPTLAFAYGGVGTLHARVEEDQLVLTGTAGAPSAILDLTAFTLSDLVTQLFSLGLLAAVVEPGLAALRAVVLLEESDHVVDGSGIVLQRWTNPVWRVLEPVARSLAAQAVRLDTAVAQLNLLLATSEWADTWGTYTGTVRQAGELDATYTARQLHELLRNRDSNMGLAALIETDTGVRVDDVRDTERDVLLLPGPLAGLMLPGPDVNACVAAVLLGGPATPAVEAAARDNVAGGITVVVIGQFDISIAPQWDFDLAGVQIGTAPPFTIGTSAVGIAKVGP